MRTGDAAGKSTFSQGNPAQVQPPLDWATHPDNPNASAETADLLRRQGGKTKKELEAAGN